MTKYTTIKDVAERAGTTASTVSYVLSNKTGRYISEKTREKVLKAAEELSYVKSNGAACLKGKDVKLVGILVPQFENQFFTKIIVATEKVFMEHGYDLIICDTFDDPKREKDFLKRMLEQRVSGVIVTPTIKGVENTKLIRKFEMPMVVVDRPLEGVSDYCRVGTDNYACGKLSAMALADKGHKNIAFVGWNTSVSDLMLRRKAVEETYEGKGTVIVEDTEFSDEAGYEATKKILAKHPEVTGIIFGFNMQAKGGVRAILDAKRTIGKDISVVMVGSPQWVDAGLNNFTHVSMGDSEVGTKAANLLLDMLKGSTSTYKQKIVQQCSLVEGTSVVRL